MFFLRGVAFDEFDLVYGHRTHANGGGSDRGTYLSIGVLVDPCLHLYEMLILIQVDHEKIERMGAHSVQHQPEFFVSKLARRG